MSTTPSPLHKDRRISVFDKTFLCFSFMLFYSIKNNVTVCLPRQSPPTPIFSPFKVSHFPSTHSSPLLFSSPHKQNPQPEVLIYPSPTPPNASIIGEVGFPFRQLPPQQVTRCIGGGSPGSSAIKPIILEPIHEPAREWKPEKPLECVRSTHPLDISCRQETVERL
jgi:hypothetical protein